MKTFSLFFMSVSMEESVLHADIYCMNRYGVMTTDMVEPQISEFKKFAL